MTHILLNGDVGDQFQSLGDGHRQLKVQNYKQIKNPH